MRVWLVHGWRTRGEYFDTLIPHLEREGISANDLDYGKTLTPWQTRTATRAAARALASVAEPGDMAVGHSNGCHVIHQALAFRAPLNRAAYLSPALNRGARVPQSRVSQIHVFHTRKDIACWFARWVPFSLWGDMGRVGARSQLIYRNHDYTHLVGGHSDWFKDPQWLAKRLASVLKKDSP